MVGDIEKFCISNENYLNFKRYLDILYSRIHPFELPGKGIFTTASVLKAFYDENSLVSETLNGFDPAKKLFVCRHLS